MKKLLFLSVVVALLGSLSWLAIGYFQPFTSSGEKVKVSIPKGSSFTNTSKLLETKDLIESPLFFKIHAYKNGAYKSIKAGEFELQRGLKYPELLKRLSITPKPKIMTITIPEGLARYEIAKLVKPHFKDNYEKATQSGPTPFKMPKEVGLEGVLYPATYQLKVEAPVRELISRQRSAFDKVFQDLDLSFAKSRGLNEYQVVILASLIEREVKEKAEMPLVASVIYNRLEKDMSLGIDATTRYFERNWTRPLTNTELNRPSPYNTRSRKGLPLGAIGNPGAEALKSATRPADTGFLFYVADPKRCGYHRFSNTYQEFLKNVAAYRQGSC